MKQFIQKLATIAYSQLTVLERMKIARKLIILFLGIGTIPLLSIGIVSYNRFRAVVEQKVQVYALDELAQTTANVLAKQREIQTISDLLFNNQAFIAALAQLEAAGPADDSARQAVTAFFGNYMLANRELFGMLYFSNAGPEHSALMVKDYQDDWLKNQPRLENTAYYRDVLKAGRSVRWSPALSIGNSHFVMSARCVKDPATGKISGILGILLDEEILDKMINDAIYSKTDVELDNVQYYSIIIDNDGKIVSTPFKADIGKHIRPMMRNTAPLQKIMKGGSSASDYSARENQGSYDGVIKNHPALVTYKSIGLNQNIGGTAGWHLVSFTFDTFLFGEVQAIGLLTLLLIIFVAALCVLLSLYIARSISRPLNQVVQAMSRAERGDLTSLVSVAAQNELGVLGNSYNRMLEKISGLVQDSKRAIAAVLEQSAAMERNSDQSAATAESVAAAMEQISQGTQEQTGAAEKSVHQMGRLSQEIEKLVTAAVAVEHLSGVTKEQTVHSRNTVQFLIRKAHETEEITAIIAHNITGLNQSAADIRSFTEVITNLAEETNLLALNASIEAARAGDLGLGFAVVAQNINQLAAQSRQAAQAINAILKTIQEKTQASSHSAEIARNIVNEQIKAVGPAEQSFADMIGAMDNAALQIDNMNLMINEINGSKEQTLQFITDISSISEEAAASAAAVSAASQAQSAIAAQVKLSAAQLRKMAEKLVEAVARFQI